MTERLVLILLIWVICGAAAAGALYSYYQDEWPNISQETWRSDFKFCVTMGLMAGPITLVVGTIYTNFWKHGWRLR
jgi:hypothetical protein